ncbi:FAD-binding oxidoreductase [Jatrophihabitans endophyticus]|uniref:NAD(P)/FAD-dependent oxidoreductase n=1 Tax=Jatrophihabitans endophyticus TaxID=1206085 RepID=UPI001A052615|nr:FAD-binding oxidoreductase [Jatrophihabitans endophyticus]MBE7188372.1 FAD-dependent oxidoreductase [Jatrophihabitans endophyticus]
MLPYRDLSLWLGQVGDLTPRPSLQQDLEADVAVVGAGFTGLWTAYYLTELDPSLSVVVLESEIAGFGASGRNGGWCSALYPVSPETLIDEVGIDAARAQYHAMRGAVDEVIRAAAAEGIEADVTRGGTILLARSEAQLDRARAEQHDSDLLDLDYRLLDADEARGRLNATGVLGGSYTPHCASVHPAKLVRGLARVVEQRGVRIFEQSPVTSLGQRRVDTAGASVRAGAVVRATEGYTARLAGSRRALAPVYSLVVATEPLPDSVWDEIGLRDRETWSDFRNLIVYGQRTADGRMVFGGRGAPYHLGSRIRPEYDRVPAVFGKLEETLHDLFPVLRDRSVTHRWGGPLGIARDWHASVGFDAATGFGWAGGYVGDGVSTTNLAGRTLADLVTGRTSELTALPWVGHRSRDWEPEPLRWIGANLGLQAMTLADRAEGRSGRPSRVAGLVNAMMGR